MSKDDTALYDPFQYRHKFACWAASRAAQRGLKGGYVQTLAGALGRCGVAEWVRTEGNQSVSSRVFDDQHRRWCRNIIADLTGVGVPTTYGRAAKLVAIYLKSMVICGPLGETELARVAHPPIDDFVLSEAWSTYPSLRNVRHLRWTQLDEKTYFDIIDRFRAELNSAPLWHIEVGWSG